MPELLQSNSENIKKYKFLIIYYLLFIIFPFNLHAQTSASTEPTFEESFIESNKAISKWFDGMADGIDLFLVGKRITTSRNESSIKIENSTFSVAGTGVTNETSISINPRFPNLEKYWNLKFSTYDEKEDSRGADRAYLRQEPRARNYGASVGLFRMLGSVRTAFQPRIELQDPLNISHSLAFEGLIQLETFHINPKLEFFANAKRGTGIFHALNFNFILSPLFSLTLLNEAEYEERLHKYSTTQGFSLGQFVNTKNVLAYGLLIFSNNRDNYHLDSYSFSVAWSHILYKKILDFKLTPHLDFLRERDFIGLAGINFQLNLNF